MQPYQNRLKPLARTLRSNMTEAEQHLWARLRRKQMQGLQFYRQKPLLQYIVDFYCPSARLVIELDGSQHFDEKNQAADAVRTAELRALGLTVLRFDNRQVLKETHAVLDVIHRHISLQIPPNPPLTKGGNTPAETKQTQQKNPLLDKGGQGGFATEKNRS